MAWIVADSFDPYTIKDDVARSVWDSATIASFSMSAATRFGSGQAISGSTAGVCVTKNCGNEPVLYLAFAYYRAGALTGTNPELYFTLRDGATAQCTVVLESSGSIVLKSGIQTGTVLATYSGAFAQDVWSHFQIRVAVSNTAGSMTVRKNGQTSTTYASGTTLDTAGGTANNYANVVVVGNGTSASPWRLDDLLVYSEAGAAPNTWVGDVRGICLMPNADTATKQFAAAPTDLVNFGTVTASGLATIAANTLYLYGPFTPSRGALLTKITHTTTVTASGHFRMALYVADALTGYPGALVAVSNELTTIASGANDFPFSPTVPVSPSLSYYFAFLVDATITNTSAASGATNIYNSAAVPYASGFPNPAPLLMTGPAGNGPRAVAVQQGNAAVVSELVANGDTDFAFDAVVGHEDLYDLTEMPGTPIAIVGVVTKAFIKKSDAGARSGRVQLKSGGTIYGGTDTVLGTTYTYLYRVDPTDPATGIAWTFAGVSALQVGQKVTA